MCLRQIIYYYWHAGYTWSGGRKEGTRALVEGGCDDQKVQEPCDNGLKSLTWIWISPFGEGRSKGFCSGMCIRQIQVCGGEMNEAETRGSYELRGAWVRTVGNTEGWILKPPHRETVKADLGDEEGRATLRGNHCPLTCGALHPASSVPTPIPGETFLVSHWLEVAVPRWTIVVPNL